MPKFRRKPVEVEAWQFDGSEAACEWVKGRFPEALCCQQKDGWIVLLATGAYCQTCDRTDWLVTERGETRVVGAMEFDAAYDRVGG